MAQTTGRDTAHGEKAAEAAAEMTRQVQEGMEATLDKAQKLAEEMTSPMLRLVLDRTPPAMRELVEKENELASFWFATGRAQLEHTLETMRHLAEARDWQDMLRIQNAWLQASMARSGEITLRQIQLVGTLAGGMMTSAKKELHKAA